MFTRSVGVCKARNVLAKSYSTSVSCTGDLDRERSDKWDEAGSVSAVEVCEEEGAASVEMDDARREVVGLGPAGVSREQGLCGQVAQGPVAEAAVGAGGRSLGSAAVAGVGMRWRAVRSA